MREDELNLTPELEQILDDWEDWRESNPNDPLHQFIQSHPSGLDRNLVDQFQRKVAELNAFDDKAEKWFASSDDDAVRQTESLVAVSSESIKPNRLHAGAVPIEGYTLVSRLGSGGFGEVWKAIGPGGFEVALKFVHTGGRVGETELRSLETMKGVRHPNLLSVFGAWQTDGMIVIASELADRTLLDRFYEVKKQGHVGIPMEELLRHMMDAAKGIDALNNPGSSGRMRIQHRDVKPQNLLLSGGGVKVSDFGLARFLQNDVMGHTGSLTMAYAAPECFDGTLSQRSDQYSLAVTFCQLCCGQLPFDGTPVEVMNGHRTKPPDLSSIPETQRPAVEKALAKLPKDRWESCQEFISHLQSNASVRLLPQSENQSSQSRMRGLAIKLVIFTIFLGFLWFTVKSNQESVYLPDAENNSRFLPSVQSTSRPRVAFLYFENHSSEKDDLAFLSKALCSMMTTGFAASNGYEVVERERLQDVLNELKLSHSDSFDQRDVAKIGKLLGAQQLVLGSYFQLLDVFRMDARIVEVETGLTVKAAGVEGRADDFSSLLRQLVMNLTNTNERAINSDFSEPPKMPAIPKSAIVMLGEAIDAFDSGDIAGAHRTIQILISLYPEFGEAKKFQNSLFQPASDSTTRNGNE